MCTNTAAIYPFYRANIHERRVLVAFLRASPLVFTLVFFAFVIVGVFKVPTLLLWLCAVTNVSMWLWITSTAVIGMFGSLATRNTLDAADALQAEEEAVTEKVANAVAVGRPATADLESQNQNAVTHVIVYPNYKEDEGMMAETLESLAESAGSKAFRVVLAMEAREGDVGAAKGERLKLRFATSFANILITRHPADLVEEHLDGSSDNEVAGKASNLKWAVKKAYEDVVESGTVDPASVVVTVADADCIFHPRYFDSIGREIQTIPREQRQRTLWQAPQLPFRNYWASPIPSRAWGYIASSYEFGGVSSLLVGGHHMLFSGYSAPLQLVIDADAWDGDVMAEDHHCFLKCFFYSVWAGGPLVQVRPVLLPVKATSVVSDQGYFQTWVERWYQAKRHAQGVAELPYALLATVDAIASLPLSRYSFAVLYGMAKVLIRLFCVHVLPLSQLLAMAVMSVYWIYNNRQVPQCPDRIWLTPLSGDLLLCGFAGAWALVWPMIIPLASVTVANVLFIWVTFLRPKSRGVRGQWAREDGGVMPTCGSPLLSVLAITAFDCVVLLGPVMFMYGFIPMCFAYVNTTIRGNRMVYITAAKATGLVASSQTYGTMGAGQTGGGLGDTSPTQTLTTAAA